MPKNWNRVTNGLWTQANYWANASVLAEIDPYLVWSDATNFIDFRPELATPKWIPIIIELKPDKTAKVFAETYVNEHWIRVASIYRSPAAGLEKTTFCTAAITKEFFRHLHRTPLRDFIKRFELGLPTFLEQDPGPDLSANKALSSAPQEASGSAAAVVGIIDDGFAFAHERFRAARASTRIEYLWLQDGVMQWEMGYGQELSKGTIDYLLANSSYASMVDEDEVYRISCRPELQRRSAHGTHVMDLACGCELEDVQAERPPRIVCVQLPKRHNRGGTPLDAHLLDGLRYILDRADQGSRRSPQGKSTPSPVVVNLSYANIAGPHDGSSIIEEAIDQLIEMRKDPGLAVVVPAGNNHLSRCRAAISIAPKDTFDLQWRILPDDATPNFLEIWLPETGSGARGIEIVIRPPSGIESPPITEGAVWTWQPGADALCTAVYLKRVASGRRNMILVAVAPTAAFDQRATAPCGIWRVGIANRSAARPLEIDAWIQRDEPGFGRRPYGRQSYFEDSDYELYDAWGRYVEVDNARSYVRREGTMNATATGAKASVIGGFRRSDGAAARYSARRPDAQPKTHRVGPDAMAVSEDSVACHGLLAAGTRSSSVVAMNGTSVAVPQIVRLLAKEIVLKRPFDRVAIRETAFAREQQVRHPSYKPKPPDEIAGEGRIDEPAIVPRKGVSRASDS